ncbi:PREDICTED: serine/threonine-protein kinase PRP4 homolog [Ceratosolen solmsi marchali]|uniref:Serine/threonine-protein kinase PRP4 homolog n=1 Tax=Ceratosolen solmsi marchali TaxID=326594 RepID=A0AAJ7DXT9_9HYME|nr:PREDICTED: serine/threonine-protein kinase PRP4 homolog [Ceratosolen solmsi marchali]
MPFFTKMSAHFRSSGYTAKESQSKSICTDKEKNYLPSKHDNGLYANKEKIAECRDNEYHKHSYGDRVRKLPNEEHSQQIKNANDNYVDCRDYRKNKEKCSSWDIRDQDIGDQDYRNTIEKGNLNSNIETRDSSNTVDIEVEDIFVNNDSLSSPKTKRNGISQHEKQRSGSLARHHKRTSDSYDRQNGKSRENNIAEPWSEEEDDEPLVTTITEERAKYANNNNNKNQMLKQIENFGSLKKRNDRNVGLNLGFRAIVDRFRMKSDNKDRGRAELSQRNKKQEYVNENWQYDNSDNNHYKGNKSPRNVEMNLAKYSKAERNQRIKDYEFEYDLPDTRRSPDKDENYYHTKGKHRHENDKSKRKSYAFEASPEDFDVRIQKYERARHDNPRAQRKNLLHERACKDFDISQKNASRNGNGTSIPRKVSLREKNKDLLRRRESTKHRVFKSKISERHSRPLTPPTNQSAANLESFQDDTPKDRVKDPSRKSFSMKEWYESNRQFATRYLKEHSKVKELSMSDVSAKDEFIFGSPTKECKTFFQIDNHERQCHYIEREPLENVGDNADGYREFTTLGQSEGTSFIKCRTNAEKDSTKRRCGKEADSVTNGRRRHRCESVEDGDEEDEVEEENEEERISRRSEICGRSFVMPRRKIWNYRDGGVHITDVEEGQPCLQCGETCSGFLPHIWR